MNRVFIDMDGVIVDFDGFVKSKGMTSEQIKHVPGVYTEMSPMPGALEAVRKIIALGYEVWIATKPATGIAHTYSDKAQWIFNWLPELERRVIVTHDKGLLGDKGDYLIDDRPQTANCLKFPGTLFAFSKHFNWRDILEFFGEMHAPREKERAEAVSLEASKSVKPAMHLSSKDTSGRVYVMALPAQETT